MHKRGLFAILPFAARRVRTLLAISLFLLSMDDSYAWQALAYVERNPVRAGIVSSAEEYDWSSAKAHATGSDVSGQLDLGPWNQMYTAPRWREALRSSLREEALAMRIREASTLGFPPRRTWIR